MLLSVKPLIFLVVGSLGLDVLLLEAGLDALCVLLLILLGL